MGTASSLCLGISFNLYLFVLPYHFEHRKQNSAWAGAGQLSLYGILRLLYHILVSGRSGQPRSCKQLTWEKGPPYDSCLGLPSLGPLGGWGGRARPVRPASQVRDQSLSHLPKSYRQTVGE